MRDIATLNRLLARAQSTVAGTGSDGSPKIGQTEAWAIANELSKDGFDSNAKAWGETLLNTPGAFVDRAARRIIERLVRPPPQVHDELLTSTEADLRLSDNSGGDSAWSAALTTAKGVLADPRSTPTDRARAYMLQATAAAYTMHFGKPVEAVSFTYLSRVRAVALEQALKLAHSLPNGDELFHYESHGGLILVDPATAAVIEDELKRKDSFIERREIAASYGGVRPDELPLLRSLPDWGFGSYEARLTAMKAQDARARQIADDPKHSRGARMDALDSRVYILADMRDTEEEQKKVLERLLATSDEEDPRRSMWESRLERLHQR